MRKAYHVKSSQQQIKSQEICWTDNKTANIPPTNLLHLFSSKQHQVKCVFYSVPLPFRSSNSDLSFDLKDVIYWSLMWLYLLQPCKQHSASSLQKHKKRVIYNCTSLSLFPFLFNSLVENFVANALLMTLWWFALHLTPFDWIIYYACIICCT